jgi:hypothetical protein
MNRKEKRRQQVLLRKLLKKGMSFEEAASQIGGMAVSLCGEHGPYSSINLCGCYGTDGRDDMGRTYDEAVAAAYAHDDGTNPFLNEINNSGFCPIHGQYSLDDLCECYDESGNLRPGWNQSIVN